MTDTRSVHRPQVYDGVHRRRNGTSFPVEVAIARRSYGGRDLMLVVARDIKGRRVLEEAVREAVFSPIPATACDRCTPLTVPSRPGL